MCFMLTIGSACFATGPAIGHQATAPAGDDRFHPLEWVAVSEEYLDKLRGGFHAGQGLTVSFGIVRTVSINGELVTRVSFNVPDVSKITAEVAKMVGTALAAAGVVQNGPGNRVDTGAKIQSATSFAGASNAATGTVQNNAGNFPEAGGNFPTAASVASPPVAVAAAVQGGGGSGAEIGAKSAASTNIASTTNPAVGVVGSSSPVNPVDAVIKAQFAANTVVQNSLNNQTIQTLTVINTGVNSMGLIKAINTQNILKDAILGSVGGLR